MNKDTDIAVIGAGAIGGVTAAFLSMRGWKVEVVCRRSEIVSRAKSPGLHVFGVKGDHHVPLKAVKDISELWDYLRSSRYKDVRLWSTYWKILYNNKECFNKILRINERIVEEKTSEAIDIIKHQEKILEDSSR